MSVARTSSMMSRRSVRYVALAQQRHATLRLRPIHIAVTKLNCSELIQF